MLKDAIAKLIDRKDLSRAEVASVFEHIFSGAATPAQIAGLMVAMRMKGERPDEIAGAAEVLRKRATRIRVPEGRVVLDTCGTGGDGAGSFNISTAVAFVAAACGVTVAKHGNRSVSSQCGSADVLAAVGVGIEVPPEVIERCLDRHGIAFLFAPGLHEVMRHVMVPRRELGIRTVFNLLGPLSNPAGATHQLLGVYDPRLVFVVAEALASLGVARALVVHGAEGLDEVSPCGPTHAAWVEGGKVSSLTINPEHAGMRTVSPESLRGGGIAENAAMLRALLKGEQVAARDAVVLNAAAALWVAGVSRDMIDGAARARSALDDGSAAAKLEALVRETSPSS